MEGRKEGDGITKRMKLVMDQVCETFGITPEELTGPSVKKKYVAAGRRSLRGRILRSWAP